MIATCKGIYLLEEYDQIKKTSTANKQTNKYPTIQHRFVLLK